MRLKKYHRTKDLLKILSDGQFHSGQTLGAELNITRSAIWKMTKIIEKQGVKMQSVNGKGYRIPNGLSFLDSAKIEAHLKPEANASLDQIICLESIDSTNTYLLKQATPQQTKIIACFAEQQTGGRARGHDRKWLSPYGNNIYHSLLWHFDKDLNELAGLSLAIGVMIQRALKKLGIEQGIEVKWPNDVLYQGKKLCGILIELIAQPHRSCAVVIGIGLNTRLTAEHKSLNRPITSTEDILNQPTDRNHLAGLILNELIPGLEAFQETGLKGFIKEWQKLDSFTGKMVKLTSNQKAITGLMRGISERGELLLEDAQGCVKSYLSGEMSLQKL